MSELTNALIQLLGSLLTLAAISLPIVIPIVAVVIYRRKSYEKTEYYAATKKPYNAVRRDLGLYGEYLIYKYLSNLAGEKRFLFNCYVPKDDGTSSEVDVVLIHLSGIYVFESKNYSGWIFGTETQKTWTQSFRNGHKEKFYNPLMQNNTHIKWLKRSLPDISEDAFRSVIVFSERCRLMKIDLTTNRHIVIPRNQVYSAISVNAVKQVLSLEAIDSIYHKLFPLTQISQSVKLAHIETVSSRVHPQSPVDNETSAIFAEPANENNAPENIVCKKCGARMILKTASRGERKGKQFWGCPNFPKCRNIVNFGTDTPL